MVIDCESVVLNMEIVSVVNTTWLRVCCMLIKILLLSKPASPAKQWMSLQS